MTRSKWICSISCPGSRISLLLSFQLQQIKNKASSPSSIGAICLLVHSSYNSCLVYIAIDVFLFYPAGRFCECVDVGCSFSLQRLVFHYTRRFSSSSFCVCCAVRGGGGLSDDLLPSSLQFSSIPSYLSSTITRWKLRREKPASYSNCHFSSIAAAAAAILRAIYSIDSDTIQFELYYTAQHTHTGTHSDWMGSTHNTAAQGPFRRHASGVSPRLEAYIIPFHDGNPWQRERCIRKTLSGSASPRSPIYPTFIPI